jgi:nickel superoxide dismutase
MKRLLSLSLACCSIFVASRVAAHCQIPCGIYGDETRFKLMNEHVTTIGKSIAKIRELGAADKPDHNQLVRWIDNKDEHADKLSHIVTYYFLAQRVKPVDEVQVAEFKAYQKKLTLLHQVLVTAMKCKQGTDPAQAAKLGKLVQEFEHAYLGATPHAHKH